MEDGATPAFIAAQQGHVAAIRVLHEFGADLNKSKADGATPVLIAAQRGHVDALRVLADLIRATDGPLTDASSSAATSRPGGAIGLTSLSRLSMFKPATHDKAGAPATVATMEARHCSRAPKAP